VKADNPNIEEFSIKYDGSNNFICGTTDDRKTVAIQKLQYLKAERHKVLVTDSYLFASNGDITYEQELLEILKSLKASEIVFCVKQIKNESLFNSIKINLMAEGCQLNHDTSLVDCHDRFWLCLETEKAVTFGTSLNGLCKRICRIDTLTEGEVNELKKEFRSRGVL
jgi:hypothetical protein